MLIDTDSRLRLRIQAFSCTQIPSQQWFYCFEDERFKCNNVPPVRSMLGYSFVQQNVTPVNLCGCDNLNPAHSCFRGPACLPLSLQHWSNCGYKCFTKAPWLAGFTQFGIHSSASPIQRKSGDDALLERNNLFGIVRQDDEHIGDSLVDILGPKCHAGE